MELLHLSSENLNTLKTKANVEWEAIARPSVLMKRKQIMASTWDGWRRAKRMGGKTIQRY